MKFLGPPSSGSIAGTTSSHNRAGQYTRNRRSPVQPVGTGRRAFIRSSFGAASAAWSALSGANQAAWNAYAAAFPITDVLGQSITLTGHQMFVSINTQMLNCQQAIPVAVPTSNANDTPAITVFTATAAGVITVTIDPAGDPTHFLLLAFSAPQSPGVGFCKTFWQEAVLGGDSIGAATYGPAYVAQFGLIPLGWKVFLKLTPVNASGVTGVPIVAIAGVT